MRGRQRRLTIAADAHIWGVAQAFSSLPSFEVDLRILESSEITPTAVRDADILLTRSATRVDASLLAGSRVRFAATATIGDDHYDKAYLHSRGIAFANAAGSSTGSVLEYMIAALLFLHQRGLMRIPATRFGIIGAGRIGGGLAAICRALGMEVRCNDPPRARREGDAGFFGLDDVLAWADVISLHTPLTRAGRDASFHLIDAAAFARFRGFGIINTARGAVVDNAALGDWLDQDAGRFAVLDCWEGEPHISRRLLAQPQVVLATPHIAGHSLDGKAANTEFIYRALCRHLGIVPQWTMGKALPAAGMNVTIATERDVLANLQRAACALYDIEHDDRCFRQCLALDDEALAAAFVHLRRHYPPRRAWRLAAVHLSPPHAPTAQLAAAIGLRVV